MHEQVANVGLTVDADDNIWMTWAHVAWYEGAAYGSIKFAKLKVR